jgi:hypothetical protein
MLLIGVLIAASMGASLDAVSADPIADSDKGELQCYRPDVEKKTCQSIASYRRTGPHTYINTALLPLGNGATLETRNPVVIKGGAVCGSITRSEVLAGTLHVPHQVIAPAAAKPILERVAQVVAPYFDKEVCTRYEPSGADLRAMTSVDGVYLPDRDVTVKWIKPTDGYVVASTQQGFRTVIPFSTPRLEAKWMEWAKCAMKNGGYGFSWVESPYGIYILAVAPGSRAEAAGLRKAQQVIEVNGQSTLGMSRNEFRVLIHSKPAAGFYLKVHGAAEVRLPPL